jgi:hypothetical protein
MQEEIMKHSDDQTLFAWELRSDDDIESSICGPLATSPSRFRECSQLVPIPDSDAPTPYSMTNKGLRFELPVVKRNDQRKGVAILQCSKLAIYPRQLTLPIVQINDEDNGQFARDGRYTYALPPVRPDKTKDAVTKIIFMKQEPEQTVLVTMVQEYNMQHWLSYRQLYRSPTLGTAPEKTNNLALTKFTVPLGHRRGFILYGRVEPDLLVLYSVEMHHRGRYSCKILPISSSHRYSKLSSTYQYRRVQELLYEIKDYAIQYIRNTPKAINNLYTANIEQRSNELHAYYTTGSDSRTSSSLDHKQNIAIWTSIAPHVVGRQIMLVLDIALLDLLETSWPFHEIEGT